MIIDDKNKIKDYMSDPEKELIKELNYKKPIVEENSKINNQNNNNDVITNFFKFIEDSNNNCKY